jgi:asparagine synthetase B (glutamine-hydrolysing)
MCGMGIWIEGNCTYPLKEIPEVLQRRGPDHQSLISAPTQTNVTLIATVLHMRGNVMMKQPKQYSWGNLCWNGEIYQYISKDGSSLCEIPPDQSDTNVVAQIVSEALQMATINKISKLEAITMAISRICNGEFAFSILSDTALYFGRDRFGRRSLLTCKDESLGLWQLSSVATSLNQSWQELIPGFVYEYNLSSHSIQFLPFNMHAPISTFVNTIPVTNDNKPNEVSNTMWQASIHFETLLRHAVKLRLTSSCSRNNAIGVMYSGGLDSAVLAGMVASMLKEEQCLELYNVVFGDGSAADRMAGYQSYKELREIYPQLDIRFITVDIQDWNHVIQIEKHIQQLIFPKTTVMDLNIGIALWFASRGDGFMDGVPYQSQAKILILGMGADEQLGGYSRHRKAHHKANLRKELTLDIERLWERNMGRDDRVLSDHGKEPRFPYLDSNVMQFLDTVPVEDICDFSLPPGQGDKRILRLIAMRMHLTTAASLTKRAIQFGSRISHVSDTKRFGSRRQAKGTSNFQQTMKQEMPIMDT